MLTASSKALGRLSGGDAVFLFDNVLGIGIIAANLSNGVCRLASEQIPHASQRCALWGIFFHRLKIISCVFSILVYSSLVRAIRPPNKDFLLCVQIALEARSKVVSRTGFSFA
jgi:hypothetical protein